MQANIREDKKMIILITMLSLIILVIIGIREDNDKNDRWPGDPNGNGNLNTIL